MFLERELEDDLIQCCIVMHQPGFPKILSELTRRLCGGNRKTPDDPPAEDCKNEQNKQFWPNELLHRILQYHVFLI